MNLSVTSVTTSNINQNVAQKNLSGMECALKDFGLGFSVPLTVLPNGDRNYCLFNENKVDFFVKQGHSALPKLKNVLQTSNDEGEIVETMYILDRMLDNGVKGIPSMYPYLSRFNQTKSPNIQVFLAGIYRKTQVPDGFGPLVSMLIQNSRKEAPTAPFNPNEEIGGAIVKYIETYSKGAPKIDYSA